MPVPSPRGGASGIRTKDDYHKGMDAPSLATSIANHLKYDLAKDHRTATLHDRYWCLARAVRDRLVDRWIETQRTYYREDAKRIYYLSMEFLIGRTLSNGLINLGMEEVFAEACQQLGYSLADLREVEPDAGLGNGGLGRLAACFLDSMATLELPATGYGLRYEFGMFRQAIRNGSQMEEPDHWLRLGNPWETARPDYTYTIPFNGRVQARTDALGRVHRDWVETDRLLAIAHDMPVPGYRVNTVNNLRLWAARGTDLFDLEYFNSGDYVRAVERRSRSENITKILYPSDKTLAGQELRLRQEYFLSSASLQDIIRRYKSTHASFDRFADKVAIQINDTHPAIAIPELMRLLVDVEGLEWGAAWDITVRVFGYTNHTLMPEALERWPLALLAALLPRHLEIIYEVNARLLAEVTKRHPGDVERTRRMSIIEEGGDKKIRMAYLATVGSHSVNGVSKLHSELLKTQLMPDFADLFPARFNNKTNGITPRRWLRLCNPGLSALITKRIGGGWERDLDRLRELVPLAGDAAFRREWREIKKANRERLVALVERTAGLTVSPAAMVDAQVKRIHEYKRQLMNVLGVADRWLRLQTPEGARLPARTVVFGGKAAPGYEMAKLIIRLLNAIAATINADPRMEDRLRVVFLEDYRVSLAEVIIPGSDLSEQISTAGMEASGTGNMKFALNGALTIGTLDGANIEIRECVGDDNIFIFGATAREVAEEKHRGYDPRRVIESTPRLKAVLELIEDGTFSSGDRTLFQPILEALGDRDPFMVCHDFSAYLDCQDKVDRAWSDVENWTRMSILNTANMGVFSSDRTIAEYARDIWHVKATPITME